ncbi:MAG: hypothetical protein U9N59_12870 [Campylobacterota bacterium]|nr:hypothetical protein [Campylobacterota bacterium]
MEKISFYFNKALKVLSLKVLITTFLLSLLVQIYAQYTAGDEYKETVSELKWKYGCSSAQSDVQFHMFATGVDNSNKLEYGRYKEGPKKGECYKESRDKYKIYAIYVRKDISSALSSYDVQDGEERELFDKTYELAYGGPSFLASFSALVLILSLIALVIKYIVVPILAKTISASIDAVKNVNPTKVCPKCAEKVKPEAMVCIHCSYEFS